MGEGAFVHPLATAVFDPHPQQPSTVSAAVRKKEEVLVLAHDDPVLS